MGGGNIRLDLSNIEQGLKYARPSLSSLLFNMDVESPAHSCASSLMCTVAWVTRGKPGWVLSATPARKGWGKTQQSKHTSVLPVGSVQASRDGAFQRIHIKGVIVPASIFHFQICHLFKSLCSITE